MSTDRPKRETMSIEEATISNMWEIAALVEVLEQKEPGDICSMTVMLSTNKHISVSAGIVRWVRGEDFGFEILVINGKAQAQLGQYIRARMMAL